MLREITSGNRTDGEYRRHWYEDERMDLFVWFDAEGAIARFQLSYDKPYSEQSIDWRRGLGYLHSRIDDGAGIGRHPGSPLMTHGGVFAKERVIADFAARAQDINPVVCSFVIETLRKFRDQTAVRRLKKQLLMIGTLLGGALVAWRFWR